MSSLKIYSDRCWMGGRLGPATVFVEQGRISRVVEEKIKDPYLEDLGSAILMPGVIDAHVHVNEPGRTHWEGFDSATIAAAAGGITTIVDMPLNASPVTTTREALNEKKSASEGKLHVNCGFYGGLIPGNLHALEDLMQSGILGIKAFLVHSGIDEFPHVGLQELEIAMPMMAAQGLPLLVHCELDDGMENIELTHQPHSYNAYLKSRPPLMETKAVEMIIALCRKHQCRTHLVHISSLEAIQLIREAKSEGLPLTAETCPHYIYFSAEEIGEGQTLFKSAPPIRDKVHNRGLKNALKEGVLDFIASDHSPAPPELKGIESGNFKKAWGGIAGLQFLLSASWTALQKELSLEAFIPLLTEHPAQFLGLDQQKGRISEGFDADLTAWDPETSFEVKEGAIFHKHKISPYVSQSLLGKVTQTWVGGIPVFREGKQTNKNAGTWLWRK
jgi:allantoinase